MKSLTPAQSLVILLLVALAISGWLYGVHWKRVASGDLFSSDDKLMIRLQDQIRSLTETNASLSERLKSYAGESSEEAEGPVPGQDPASPLRGDGMPEPESPGQVPLLPSRPQKIETH